MNFLKTTLLTTLTTVSLAAAYAQEDNWNAADIVMVNLQAKALSFANYYQQDQGLIDGFTSSFAPFKKLVHEIMNQPGCEHLTIDCDLGTICSPGSAAENLVNSGGKRKLFSIFDRCLETVKEETEGKQLKSLVLCISTDAIPTQAQSALQEYFAIAAQNSALFSQITFDFNR